MLSERSILQCPACEEGLKDATRGLRCESCDVVYPENEGQIDLRIRNRATKEVEFVFDGSRLDPNDFEFGIEKHPAPEVEWSKLGAPDHIDETLLTHVPKAESSDERAIDVGCGDGIHERLCRKAGYDWVGLDIQSETAPVLGDAHALPFEDSSFDFAISFAVLEHVSNPFVMVNEINRVLEPGSKFIGTVAFLEPFHGNSHYHHSPLGTIHLLREAGFTVEEIGPGWHALVAIGRKLFPMLPDRLLFAETIPVRLLNRLWYKVGRLFYDAYAVSEQYREISTAGSFKFVAVN